MAFAITSRPTPSATASATPRSSRSTPARIHRTCADPSARRRKRYTSTELQRSTSSTSTPALERPLPPCNLRPINPVLVRIANAVEDLVLQPFLGVRRRAPQLRHPINHVDRLVKTVHLVQNRQFQRRVDVAFLLVP